jgi:ribosomal protein S1
MESTKVYNGYVSYYNTNKHFGFIECEDGNSYYFFLDAKDLKRKNRELYKMGLSILKKKIYTGDEVNFKLKNSNDKIEAYDMEFVGNYRRQLLIDEAVEKQTLLGYLKQIEGNFFVKHISTYVFVPLKISVYEIDIDSVYTQRLNQLVKFKLEQKKHIDKLSAILVDRKFSDSWEKVKEAFDTQENIMGYIKRRTNGGMIVDVFGIEAFLPGSQIDVKPVRDYDDFIGKTMEFKIVQFYEKSGNIVVSHKEIIAPQLEEQREQIVSQLEKGQVLEGIVKNITNYGVFMDLGGIDGLIHISDLSWERVTLPKEIVTLEQRLKVVVLDFDVEKKRISLGLKQLYTPIKLITG